VADPVTLTYGDLAQTHEEYDAKLWRDLWLLYRGGFELLEHAGEFLHRAPNEPEDRYQHRLKSASYVCYFGQIVDYLVGALFFEKLLVVPAAKDGANAPALPDETFWRAFGKDVDRSGTPVAALFAQAITTALVLRRAWVAVDLPEFAATVELPNRAEEDRLGLNRAYAFQFPAEEVINWHRDADGRLQWVVTRWQHVDRSSPLRRVTEYRERFKVWRREAGAVSWETFETGAHKLEGDERPRDEEALTLIDEGATSFREIPFVEIELPYGLWAGNKIGPLALEHFRLRSDLKGSLNRSLVEIPVVNLAPEIPGVGEALPAQAVQRPDRGNDPVGQYERKGYLVLGHNEKLEFTGPSGKGFEVADKQLSDLRDEMYRTVTAMSLSLANTGAAVGRSGESKREDRSATEIVLDALGDIVRRAAVRVYDVVAGGRGDRVEWEAQGLTTFNVGARGELVEEAERVLPLNVPSPTFRKEYLTRVALALTPNAAPETKQQIQQEIASGVDEADELARLMQQQATVSDQDEQD